MNRPAALPRRRSRTWSCARPSSPSGPWAFCSFGVCAATPAVDTTTAANNFRIGNPPGRQLLLAMFCMARSASMHLPMAARRRHPVAGRECSCRKPDTAAPPRAALPSGRCRRQLRECWNCESAARRRCTPTPTSSNASEFQRLAFGLGTEEFPGRDVDRIQRARQRQEFGHAPKPIPSGVPDQRRIPAPGAGVCPGGTVLNARSRST